MNPYRACSATGDLSAVTDSKYFVNLSIFLPIPGKYIVDNASSISLGMIVSRACVFLLKFGLAKLNALTTSSPAVSSSSIRMGWILCRYPTFLASALNVRPPILPYRGSISWVVIKCSSPSPAGPCNIGFGVDSWAASGARTIILCKLYNKKYKYAI